MSAQRQTTRRDFLAGRSAVKALQDLPAWDEARTAGAESLQELDSPRWAEAAQDVDQAVARSYVIQVGRDAMACEFQVLLNAGQHEGATEAALEALDLVERWEDQLTVFREHSEISRINQAASSQPVAVEPRLFQLLQQAIDLHRATAGAFDITASPLWNTWGFHRRSGRFPTQAAIDEALANVGSQWVQLDVDARTVRFQRPGLELNLGAIGKGFALDRCGELLAERGVEDFVMHGGRSSILAQGSRLGADPEVGWTIVLKNPLRHDQELLQLRLRNQALATSGSGNQFFHFDGKRYGHVIDPRTGFPADQLLSATVLASSAALADALATAFFVMGAESALDFCAQRQDLAVILVCPGERSGALTVHTHGLADDAWRRLS